MTDENDDLNDAPESTDEDIADALEATGYVEADAEGEAETDDDAEQSKVGGLMDKISAMSGSGKPLDSYENDPVASIFADDDGEIPRGAKHIARGVDGLSPVAAAHPLIDIGVGFVLLSAEGKIDGNPVTGDDTTEPPDKKPEDGDDSDSRGDMLT